MKKAILYGGVAVLLVLGLVLGIVWTKQRSQTFASKPTPTQQRQPDKQAPAQQQTSKDTQPAKPDVAAQPAPASHPAVVPATGSTNVAASIIGFMAIALSASWYMQTRHRLMTIR